MLGSLKRRILFAFFVSLVIFCVTLFVGYKKYSEESKRLEKHLQKQYTIHGILYKARNDILLLENIMYKSLYENRPVIDIDTFNKKIDGIVKRLSEVAEMIGALNKLYHSPKTDFMVSKIGSINVLLEAKKEKSIFYENERFDLIKQEFDTIEKMFLMQFDEHERGAVEEVESMKKSIILYSTLVMVLLFISLVYVANLFLRPVLKLNSSIEELLESEFDIKKRISTDDGKIGHLAESFNRFLDKVQDLDEKLLMRTKDLEKRVKEEVDKNREKDIIMLKQSHASAIGKMIENISHQWRQPLNALGLNIQDIEDAYDYGELDEEYVRNSVERSMSIIESMSMTIDKFRDFYSPNIERCKFSINNAIEETMKLFAGVFGEHFIRVKLNCQEDVSVIGYPNEFSQVIFNILNNSKDVLIKNNEKLNREIEIDLKKEDDLITLLISDNAGGIKKEIIDRVFDPYFTTKEHGGGVGLGLYMSKIIIENNMDGSISAYNGDKGVVIKITLNSL